MTDASTKFTLAKWAETMELSEDTIWTLEKEKFNFIRTLKTLYVEPSIDTWGLPLGQLNLLKLAVKELCEGQNQMQPQLQADPKVTTKTLAADQELNARLKFLKQACLKDILDLEAHNKAEYLHLGEFSQTQ
jgi:hypothetical protein